MKAFSPNEKWLDLGTILLSIFFMFQSISHFSLDKSEIIQTVSLFLLSLLLLINSLFISHANMNKIRLSPAFTAYFVFFSSIIPLGYFLLFIRDIRHLESAFLGFHVGVIVLLIGAAVYFSVMNILKTAFLSYFLYLYWVAVFVYWLIYGTQQTFSFAGMQTTLSYWWLMMGVAGIMGVVKTYKNGMLADPFSKFKKTNS